MANNEQNRRTVEVQLLGQRMVLRSDDDSPNVERLAAYVKRKLDEVGVKGPLSAPKHALLAALNIADEYFRAVDEMRELKRQIAAKSRALLAEMDE